MKYRILGMSLCCMILWRGGNVITRPPFSVKRVRRGARYIYLPAQYLCALLKKKESACYKEKKMEKLKEQSTEYLEDMIEACHELWAWYRGDNDTEICPCPLCETKRYHYNHSSYCRECPWVWFSGHTCEHYVERWEGNYDMCISILREIKELTWATLRNRQLPRWIAYMEAEIEDRK